MWRGGMAPCFRGRGAALGRVLLRGFRCTSRATSVAALRHPQHGTRALLEARGGPHAGLRGVATGTEGLEKVRNVGIMAHIDAGKTTVTERMLFFSNFMRKFGEVHEGDTVMDYMDQERERGITINAAAISFQWNGFQINLIDTPGHVDFTMEVERSLRVLDGVVAVFDGVAGVEAQSETVWRQANTYSVPRLAFVNKMDREGADLEHTLQGLRSRLNTNPLVIQMPIGARSDFKGVVDLLDMQAIFFDPETEGRTITSLALAATDESAFEEHGIQLADLKEKAERERETLIEAVGELDDDIMELFVEGKEVSGEALRHALRRLTVGGDTSKAVVVMLGSALKNKGVQPLMDAVNWCLPSPLDRPAIEAVGEKGKLLLRKPSTKDPFTALAFKVVFDKHMGDLVYIRCYSGSMEPKQSLQNTTQGKAERPSKILRVLADDYEEIAKATAGEIFALQGLKHTRTGDTLVLSGDKALPKLLGLEVPPPVFFCTVEVESAAEEKQLNFALQCVQREDPSLSVREDSETGALQLGGMGELHLEVVMEKIRRQFGVNVLKGRLQITYRESVSGSEERTVKRESSVGGKKVEATVCVRVSPQQGSEYPEESTVSVEGCKVEHQAEDKRSGGDSLNVGLASLGNEAVKAVVQGVHDAMSRGPNLGVPVIGAHVQVLSVSVGSEVSASVLRFAATKAASEATAAASPITMEPLMRVEVTVPESQVGAVLSDMNSNRRAEIGDLESLPDGRRIVRCCVPLERMVGYATDVRSMTGGQASFHMTFSHFAVTTSRD